MEYQHITYAERRRIERALGQGKSLRWIAHTLYRSVSSISEEVRLGSARGVYTAQAAQRKANLRRKQAKQKCLKVAMDPKLKEYVTQHIADDQSPEGVSGRLKHVEKGLRYASPKAIYKFVYSVHGRQVEKHLYSKSVKKKSGPKRGTHKPKEDGRTMIDKRPKKIEHRTEFGHFEGDFIESGKDGTGSLLVLVEGKTRYPFIAYTKDRTTAHINALVEQMLRGAPVKSITLDNDLSFQKHEELSEMIGATVFFCHPFCSQEKGTVENRNKAVRRYAPKRTDFSLMPEQGIKEIEEILRTRFMKCLDFNTPREVWDEEIEKWRKKSARATVRTLKKRADARVINR